MSAVLRINEAFDPTLGGSSRRSSSPDSTLAPSRSL